MQGLTTGRGAGAPICRQLDDTAWRAAMAAFGDTPAVTGGRWRGLLGFVCGVVMVAALSFGFTWRDKVVAAVPPLARAFAAVGAPVNIRGLEFRAVRASTIAENGQRALVVEGDIVSLRGSDQRVPDLRFALRRPDGRDGYVWTSAASEPRIGPGATLHFRAKLVSPPDDGHDVLVTFAEEDGRGSLQFWK